MPAFVDTVESFLKENQIICHSAGSSKCPDCKVEWDDNVCPTCKASQDLMDEPHFSWRGCEVCGSGLGGNRHPYTFLTESKDIFETDVCEDCLYYLTYGEIPKDYENEN